MSKAWAWLGDVCNFLCGGSNDDWLGLRLISLPVRASYLRPFISIIVFTKATVFTIAFFYCLPLYYAFAYCVRKLFLGLCLSGGKTK